MRILPAVFLFFFLAGCASGPAKDKPEVEVPITPEAVADPAEGEARIDIQALQKSLRMDRSAESLGYRESSFNTCQVGYGYSSTKDCRRSYIVAIHYKLQCRESEGTVSTALTSDDIRPLSFREIRWHLRNQKGVSQTDQQGLGQIIAIFSDSPKSQRLKLGTGNEFLYLRAGEINRIVTPQPWCDAR